MFLFNFASFIDGQKVQRQVHRKKERKKKKDQRKVSKTWCLTSTETIRLIRDVEKAGGGGGGGSMELGEREII